MVGLLRIANLVLLVVNLALFALWFSLIRRDALPSGGDQTAYVLNQVSVQVTILGIMVAFGALLLAGLGVFGFQAVMDRAANRAEEIARKLVAEKWDELVRQESPIVFRSRPGPLPDASDAQEVRE